LGSNVDNARRSLECFSRDDVESALAFIDPEVEWHRAFHLPGVTPDKAVFHGHEEVRQLWTEWRSVWDEISVQIEEVLHDADDVAVARTRFRARGAASGAQVERRFFYVMNFRDGKLVRSRPFEDLGEARRAAGLDDV
jgi:ketosteroid isomerase-like protein